MVKNQEGAWSCTGCGRNLEVDRRLLLENAVELAHVDGPLSAAGLSVIATAAYIRKLELRWIGDQRRIRELERQLARHEVYEEVRAA